MKFSANKGTCALWLSVLSIAIAIIMIFLFCYKVRPYSVVTVDTFIGVIAAFIGICVTLLIGYQIYNAMEIKSKLSEIDILKAELKDSQSRLDYIKCELYEAFHLLQSENFSRQNQSSLEAFLHLIAAVPYSLSVNHKKGYRWLMNELNERMLCIVSSSFLYVGTAEEFKKAVDTFKESYHSDDKSIRNHPYFLYIKDPYEELMDKFDKRLAIIAQAKNPSLEILDVEAGKEDQ